MTDPSSPARPRAVPEGAVTRFGRMGGMAVGVAGRMAVDGLRQYAQGKRPASRDLLMTPANMRRIADELARMRGAAMKMGQLVSMDTGDVLPPELADILARLRADADFMPPKQLRDVLDAAWGKGWYSRFAKFDVRPMAAASIGQVHRARLPDGKELAIKVQYPGIARSIDSDVNNIGRLMRMSGLLPEGFDLAPYLDEARTQLKEEADYEAEAGHLRVFRQLLGDDADFALPEVEEALSTDKVLAMTYLPSAPIESLTEAPQDLRDRVIEQLCGLMLREVFDFGVMQTDPNFANYRYDEAAGRIVLLDFGATRRLPSELAGGLRDLIGVGMRRDWSAVSDLLDALGLVPHQVEDRFRARILEMVELVFEEILAAPVLDLNASSLSKRLQRAGEALAADGFVPPPVPMDLLYVQRKVAGMFLLASRLKARVPVQALVAPHLGLK